MKYFSLFSGIGGFELGIQQAYEQKNKRLVDKKGQMDTVSGRQETLNSSGMGNTYAVQSGNESDKPIPICIGYSEIDKYAIQIYQKHFPNHTNYGDITKINADELPDFDFLCGGFPCQAFSIAGLRRGFEDTRGTLFFEIARILQAKRPSLLLLENVKGLLSHDKGATFERIIQTLDELGYDLQWQVLNSKNFGVPQNRERVFIVGHLRGTSRPEVFPFTSTNDSHIKLTTQSVQQQDRTISPEGISPCLASNTTFDKWNVDFGEMKIRRLTPTECERLQGFPDNWTEGISDTQRYKCLGNAVTVNVIQAIIEKLLK